MDYQTEYLDKNPNMHIEDASIKFKELKSELKKLKKVRTMLDVGCGAGVLTKKIFGYLKAPKTLGVDVSQKMIDTAKSINKDNPQIDFFNASVFNLKNGFKYDLIVGSDIIEHVENDVKFLEKLGSIGKSIILRVPLENSIMNRVLIYLFISNELKKTEDKYGHIHHYSKESFLKVVNSAGLKTKSYSLFLINKPRSWWLNEILRYLSMIVGLFSLETAVKFGGGFIVVTLTK